MVTGIILAAGESKRMGYPKQLLPWGNKTILQQVIDTASSSSLGAILVVLGHRADEISQQISTGTSTRVLINGDYLSGMGSSIACGVKNAPAESGAFLVLLGDQPFVSAETIDALIRCHHERGSGITIPTYDGRRGHPVIFDVRYRQELLLIGAGGGREIVRKHAEDVLEMPFDSPTILSDIDTPEEYQLARKWGSHK